MFAILFGDSAAFDRFRWFVKRMKGGDIRTLDAGCGSGALTLYAAKRGNEAVGISFDERNNRMAEERARILGIERAQFVTGDLRKLDTLAPSLGVFEQIICFETIEHIKMMRSYCTILRAFSGRVEPYSLRRPTSTIGGFLATGSPMWKMRVMCGGDTPTSALPHCSAKQDLNQRSWDMFRV